LDGEDVEEIIGKAAQGGEMLVLIPAALVLGLPMVA
jgi:hypothetical protein